MAADPSVTSNMAESQPAVATTITTTTIVEKSDRDVITGRGGASSRHPGNVLYRQLVACRKHVYALSDSPTDKREMATGIIKEVLKTGGRFLTFNKDIGKWVEMDEISTIKKVMQALREGAEETRVNEQKREISQQLEQQRKRKSLSHIHVSKEPPKQPMLNNVPDMNPCGDEAALQILRSLPNSQVMSSAGSPLPNGQVMTSPGNKYTINSQEEVMENPYTTTTVRTAATGDFDYLLNNMVEDARRLQEKAHGLRAIKNILEDKEKKLQEREEKLKDRERRIEKLEQEYKEKELKEKENQLKAREKRLKELEQEYNALREQKEEVGTSSSMSEEK